eukprot:14804.XXX_711538_711648_1 [CDS] Oithona nana genome sequencing.
MADFCLPCSSANFTINLTSEPLNKCSLFKVRMASMA